MAIFALPVVVYAAGIAIVGERMYTPGLADSFKARPWGIIPHALFGSIALFIGPLQFHPTLRSRRLELHRWLGRTYVMTALITGVAGVYMAAYSLGGWITHIGFGLLGLGLIICTTQAFRRIRERRVTEHRRWMIRSYAFLYSAVTLRLEIPFLVIALGGEFLPAYQIVSWLSWVPNILFAEWLIRRDPQGALVPAVA